VSELGSRSWSTEPAANVAVIYHSRKGTQHALALAAAAGARDAGATVRLLRIPAIDADSQDLFDDDGRRPPAPTHDDLLWADGIVWGTPTHYGNVSASFKRFIDSTSDLWSRGLLADCAVTGMTSSTSPNGGQEATLSALYRSMYHWGALVMSADPAVPGWQATGANPFGLSVCASYGKILDVEENAAQETGRRVARLAGRVRALRDHRIRGQAIRSLRQGRTTQVAVLFQDGDAALAQLAEALAAGVRDAGGDTRVRRIPCLAGDALDRGAAAGAAATASATVPAESESEAIPFADPDDVAWADALAWGAHPAAGSAPPELMRFLQATEAALPAERYSNKAVTAFGTTLDVHAGGESMLLSVYTAMHTWSALIVAPGYTDPVVTAAGGNPYGTLHVARNGLRKDDVLAAARHQGFRLAAVTQRIGPAGPPD
jgi:multimeric flavodoxin WrbA